MKHHDVGEATDGVGHGTPAQPSKGGVQREQGSGNEYCALCAAWIGDSPSAEPGAARTKDAETTEMALLRNALSDARATFMNWGIDDNSPRGHQMRKAAERITNLFNDLSRQDAGRRVSKEEDSANRGLSDAEVIREIEKALGNYRACDEDVIMAVERLVQFTSAKRGTPIASERKEATGQMEVLLKHACTLLRASRYALRKMSLNPEVDHAGYFDSVHKLIAVIEHHYDAPYQEVLGENFQGAQEASESSGALPAATATQENLVERARLIGRILLSDLLRNGLIADHGDDKELLKELAALGEPGDAI